MAFLRCEQTAVDADKVVLLIDARDTYVSGREHSLLEREHAKQFVERFMAVGDLRSEDIPHVRNGAAGVFGWWLYCVLFAVSLCTCVSARL